MPGNLVPVAPPAPLERLLTPSEDRTETPTDEEVPLRTGSLVGGLAAATATGLVLGLRDRRLTPPG